MAVPLARFAADLVRQGPAAVRFPNSLEPSQRLHDAMQNLWQRSIFEIANGRVREYGATLALDDRDELQLVNAVAGSASAVTPDFNVAQGLTPVGFFHTHPSVDRSIRGCAFSDADIIGFINDGEFLSLVQSESYLFALVRSARTPETVNDTELWQIYQQAYQEALEDGQTVSRAVFFANLEICSRYRLAFYRGRIFGRLREAYIP